MYLSTKMASGSLTTVTMFVFPMSTPLDRRASTARHRGAIRSSRLSVSSRGFLTLPPALPLATLIGRELRGGGSERPLVRYGHSGFAKRGEDYFLVKPDCLRVPGAPSSACSVFAVRALS